MGMYSDTLTALFSIRRKRAEEAPMADLTGIKAPPTPEGEEGFIPECPADVDEVEIATPPFSEDESVRLDDVEGEDD